jgi:hypothetical protein
MSNLVMLESLNLAGCEQLTKLPGGIIRNSNLMHLRNDQCRTLEGLPSGLGSGKNLKHCPYHLGDKHSGIAELEDLNLLTGELRIECWSNKNDLTTDAKRANIRNKRKLSSLTLSWSHGVDVHVMIPQASKHFLKFSCHLKTLKSLR